MINIKELRALDLDSMEGYFEYIKESKKNGQFKQVKELLKNLSAKQYNDFLVYLGVDTVFLRG